MARKNSYTLSKLWEEKCFKFPLVVKQTEADYEIPGQLELPDDIVLLDEVTHVHFARIKVLPFDNDAAIVSEKGDEFVESRNEAVGKEFLLPIKYKGKLRFVPKPRLRQRFTAVDQVSKRLYYYLQSGIAIAKVLYWKTSFLNTN